MDLMNLRSLSVISPGSVKFGGRLVVPGYVDFQNRSFPFPN
jgi:hypothetical protein